MPGGWFDACAVGVPGDRVIRAVVDCADATPAASVWRRLVVAALLLVGAALVIGARRSGAHSR